MRHLTKREHATLFDAYQLLAVSLLQSKGADVKVLDNLWAMMEGRKLPHRARALRKAHQGNQAAISSPARTEPPPEGSTP